MRYILSLLGIHYAENDLNTTYENPPYGKIMNILDLDIHIFQIGETTAILIPAHLVNHVSPSLIRKRYFEFLSLREYDAHIVYKFIELVDRLLPTHIWEVHIKVMPLEDYHDVIETRDVRKQKIHVTSYLITQKHPTELTLHLNVRDIFRLCKTVIDSNYIVDALVPSSTTDVLVTLFQDDDDILAMRATTIKSGTMTIKGAYACGEGYGRLIQEHTENLIRSNKDGFFTVDAYRKKKIHFTLSTLPTAKSFWSHIGFEDTGKLDKEGNSIMRKRLYPSDDESVLTTSKTSKRGKHGS